MYVKAKSIERNVYITKIINERKKERKSEGGDKRVSRAERERERTFLLGELLRSIHIYCKKFVPSVSLGRTRRVTEPFMISRRNVSRNLL